MKISICEIVKSHNAHRGIASMTKTIRNILIFPLLFLAALPAFFSVSFLIKQAYIRHTMKEALVIQQLKIIILNKKAIHWVEQDREILIDDHFFDVEKITSIHMDSVRIEGLFDYEEDALYASLHNALYITAIARKPTVCFQCFSFSLSVKGLISVIFQILSTRLQKAHHGIT